MIILRITATVKGELESYVNEQIEKTGFSSAQCLVNLALQGMEYKQALSTMGTFAKALEQQKNC